MTRKRDRTPERAITWGDLIEAAEELIRRNVLKNQQLAGLVADLRRRQQAGEVMPLDASGASEGA